MRVSALNRVTISTSADHRTGSCNIFQFFSFLFLSSVFVTTFTATTVSKVVTPPALLLVKQMLSQASCKRNRLASISGIPALSSRWISGIKKSQCKKKKEQQATIYDICLQKQIIEIFKAWRCNRIRRLLFSQILLLSPHNRKVSVNVKTYKYVYDRVS